MQHAGVEGSSSSGGNGSVDKVSFGEDGSESEGSDKGGERCSGNGGDKGGSSSWLGVSKARSKDLRHADKGARFIAGTGGRPGGDSGSEDSTGKDGGSEDGSGRSGGNSNGKAELGQLVTGGGGAGLRLSDMGATGVQDMVVAITCQWPLGRLSIGGNKTGGVSRAKGGSSDVMGRVGMQANVKGIGEGSGGAAGALATKSVGDISVSGAGGKGVWAEGKGVGRARRSSSESCSILFFIICTMSWNCHSELGVSLAWSLG